MHKFWYGGCLLVVFLGVLYSDPNRELLLAISQKNFESVQNIIENKKASVSYRDVNKRTPLHWAVIAGDLKIVAYLIYKGADIEAVDKNKATPLHYVAYSKNLDILKYLVQQNANINAVDDAGWTPLHYYTYYQFEMGVKYLIYAEANLELKTTKPAMNIPAGSTALDIALKINKQVYIDALTSPQKYQNIANRPVLSLEVQHQLSLSNALFSQEKGFLTLTVRNNGQGTAHNTFLEFSGLTNRWVFLQTNLEPRTIGIGNTTQWKSEIIAFDPPTDTTVRFRVRAVDEYSKRASEWQTVHFMVMSNRPPSLIIGATLIGETNVLRPLAQTSLILALSNEGLGPLREAFLFLRDSKRYLIPQRVGPFFLPPYSSTNFSLLLTTTDTVEDGETTLEIEIRSSYFPRSFVFSRLLPTKGYLPPMLSFYPTLYRRLQLSILTNQVLRENGEETTTITTNTSLLVYPMLELINSGERPVTNLSVEIRIPTETNIFLYTYAISSLFSGEKRNLAIPLEKSLLSNRTISLEATDGFVHYLSTNISLSLWPEE